MGLQTIYLHRTPQALVDWKNAPRLEPWCDDIGLLGDLKFSGNITNPERILLTGATGFVGVYVLRELLEQTKAKIICLVRAETTLEARARLKQNAFQYNLELDFSRIELVLGSLEQLPEFDDIDTVFHVAASTDLRLDYSAARATNVLGTVKILKLGLPTHLISSVSVFNDQNRISCTEDLESELVPGFGYAQTKWVSDVLAQRARASGLQVWVYRIGRVWGDTFGGATPSSDALWQTLKNQADSGLARPSKQNFDVMPVDWMARALVKLAFAINPQNVVLRHPKPISRHEFNDKQGFEVNIAGIQLEPFPANRRLLELYMPKMVNSSLETILQVEV